MAARAKKDEEPERLEDGSGSGDDRAEKRARARPAAERGTLAALVDGLEEIVPGIQVLDRELVFESGARADLAAVDPSGRLHLVLVAGQDADKTALEALDAIALLRAQMELLVRHLDAGHVDPERAPRLIVVSPSSDTRLAERLRPLADAGVVVLGLRTVKSASGERAYLVRLDSADHVSAGATGVPAFLRALPARLEPLGNTLVERMQRLDEDLVSAADGASIVWRLGGDVLCRVERVGDVLQASVAPRHEPLPLADPADLDRLVEKALARLVAVLGLSRGERPPATARNASGPRDPDEPILTAEEIQAFRE